MTGKLTVVQPDELLEQLRTIVREELAEGVSHRTAPALLDRRGLAAALGCGVDTVDKLRRDGLPTVMLCDSPRFELAEVLAWLKGRNR